MSETHDLDLREQIARIRRAQEETDKFAADQRKLIAEAGKFDRDRTIAPWLAAASVLGGILGLATFIATFFLHLAAH